MSDFRRPYSVLRDVAGVTLVLPLAMTTLPSAEAAGVVTVKKTGNKLLITGDGKANRIVVSHLRADRNDPQTVDVVKQDADTTVVGDASLRGFTGDVEVQLNGGDDNVRFEGRRSDSAEFGNVTVNMGEDGPNGQEVVNVFGMWIRRNLKIRAAGRSITPNRVGSAIRVDGCRIDGNVDIDSGEGNDDVAVLPSAPQNVPPTAFQFQRIGGNLSIHTRGGVDVVALAINGVTGRVQVDGDVAIGTGAGNDTLTLSVLSSKAGDGGISLIGKSLQVNMGDGSDVLRIGYLKAGKAGSLDGGGGTRDEIQIWPKTEIPNFACNRTSFEIVSQR